MINNFGIPHVNNKKLYTTLKMLHIAHVNNKKFYTTLKVLHLINACMLWYCITHEGVEFMPDCIIS